MKTTYRLLLLAFTGLVFAGPASAISRQSSMAVSCAAAQDMIRAQGAVILRHPSIRVKGMTLYDRYVRESAQCNVGEYADRAYVPTADTPRCPVLNCQKIEVP